MVKAKKSLGQNFLIDKNIIKKIVSLEKIENCNVVEIGPGTGSLTNEIIKYKPKKITLIEKDYALFKVLKEKIKFEKNLDFINNDILNFDLENKIEKDSIIFGNLPYNISTQILVRLIKCKEWPPKYKKLVLMFQKEVAERIVAKHNSSKYGRLTVMANWRLKVTKSFNVSKNCFYPKPKVDSTVLVFQPVENKLYKIKNINNLEKITQAFFSGKRKMINKAFIKLFSDYNVFSKKIKIDLSSRPDQISKEYYYKMTEHYENK